MYGNCCCVKKIRRELTICVSKLQVSRKEKSATRSFYFLLECNSTEIFSINSLLIKLIVQNESPRKETDCDLLIISS